MLLHVEATFRAAEGMAECIGSRSSWLFNGLPGAGYAPVMRIVGLDHVQLAMPAGEEAAVRRFYGEILGLTEVPKPEPLAARGGCWFEGGGAIVHLGVQADFRPATKAHAAFLVQDLEESRAVLARAGIEAIEDDALTETSRLYLHDPFGNRLELIQTGDGFSQRQRTGASS